MGENFPFECFRGQKKAITIMVAFGLFKGRHRLTVRTAGFQSANRGSIPRDATTRLGLTAFGLTRGLRPHLFT